MASRKQTSKFELPSWLKYAFLGVFFGLICLMGSYFGVCVKREWDKASKLAAENDLREQKLHRDLFARQELTKDIAFYSTPAGKELAARQKKFVKPGERLLLIGDTKRPEPYSSNGNETRVPDSEER